MRQLQPIIRFTNCASSGVKTLKTENLPQETNKKYSTVTQLPKLPVPALSQTLEKYLKTVKPVVSDAQYVETEKVVREFGRRGGIGEKLQLILEERAKARENWLSEWWINTAYFDFRAPVVVYSNPALVGPLQNFNSQEDQLKYASRVVCGALKFKKSVEENSLPLEKLGNAPLDMSQYYRILSTCRIPGEKRDSLVCYFNDKPCPSHIIVIHNNQFFKVQVYDKNGYSLSEDQILGQLQQVVSESITADVNSVGILTNGERNEWSKVYSKLSLIPSNREVFTEIHKSLFVLCLDQANPSGNSNRKHQAGSQIFHGNGSRVNSGNRWCDKTVQFIVGRDGAVGILYEHSPAEGPIVASLINSALDYANGSEKSKTIAQNTEEPKQLAFELNEEIVRDIEYAKTKIDKLISNVELTLLTFNRYGKEFMKSQKLSPDSFIQMAFQLGFYSFHKTVGACYETASTRMYHHGRTETIRSATPEAADMCRTFFDRKSSNVEKARSLRKAIEAHKNYVIEAIKGYGVDRHLLGLKLIASEYGIDTPSVYKDPAYSTSSHFRLSTSQVAFKSSEGIIYFGPGVPDGYGLCYNPASKSIAVSITAFNDNPETSAEKLKQHIENSLIMMSEVLTSSESKL